MRASVAIALASCVLLGGSGLGQDSLAPRKLLCIIEKAAGVIYDDGAKAATPRAINFEEQHKRFVVTIRRIVRDQMHRDMCRANLAYWMPLLAEKGTFDPSDQPSLVGSADINKFKEYRYNIGRCFASDEATIKFFDRDYESRLASYDFRPQMFAGLPGEWLELRADNFEAGERLDAGPVVFTGKCQQID